MRRQTFPRQYDDDLRAIRDDRNPTPLFPVVHIAEACDRVLADLVRRCNEARSREGLPLFDAEPLHGGTAT